MSKRRIQALRESWFYFRKPRYEVRLATRHMAAPHARIGQLLGDKYRLQELLALGGMGLVFGGKHLATGRSVAVKLLRSELLTEPEIVRRVSLEARLAVEAAHPNVVDV